MQRIVHMQERAAAAVVHANAASECLLQALARHAANIRARSARVVDLHKNRLDDAAVEADTNANQLRACAAALLKFAVNNAFNVPPVFVFQIPTHLVFPVAQFTPNDPDVALLHRVYSAEIDVARTSVSGQGLTVFYPSDGFEVYQ